MVFKRGMAALLAAAMVMSAGVADIGIQMSSVVAAENFTVSEKSAVLYTCGETKVYKIPDSSSEVITTIAKDVPVQVTGITSNGWFRVNINGTYYVSGDSLSQKEQKQVNNIVSSTDINKLTKGTFSFFSNNTLREFDKEDIEDMDDNTYIKYLDSFLMGYALLDYCIIKDNGNTLRTEYDKKAKKDKEVASMSLQEYLINYRNNYMSNSLMGPFRSEKELKIALNRAIRYEIGTFGAVYKSAAIGNDEEKMKKLIEKVIARMKAEQGVKFTCRMEYGTYKDSDGEDAKGWIIEFTQKDN